MDRYPFARVLHVKRLREQAALGAVTRLRGELEAAENAAASARRRVESYRAARPGREVALFEAIRGQAVARPRLDRYHAALADMAREEQDLVAAAESAGEAADAVREALAGARLEAAAAGRRVRKFEEHRSLWRAAAARAAEAAEEKEQEDRSMRP